MFFLGFLTFDASAVFEKLSILSLNIPTRVGFVFTVILFLLSCDESKFNSVEYHKRQHKI